MRAIKRFLRNRVQFNKCICGGFGLGFYVTTALITVDVGIWTLSIDRNPKRLIF